MSAAQRDFNLEAQQFGDRKYNYDFDAIVRSYMMRAFDPWLPQGRALELGCYDGESTSWLLTKYRGVRMFFVAPPELQIGKDILAALDAAGVKYELTADFEKVMPDVDAIYMTRIQDEWDKSGESAKLDVSRFHLRAEHLARLKPHAAILHPLPRRDEIATEIDADPRAMYWRQVRNGMWIRAALILSIFERDAEADRYYQDLTS